MKCELNRSLARFTRGQKVSNEDFLAEKYKKMKNYFVFGKFVCYFVAWNAPWRKYHLPSTKYNLLEADEAKSDGGYTILYI